ncbi:hypothetical protein ACLI1A_04805 [Flavobacterium sp. RHBU_3]|uniref:hypothetical protein n=1 Tax=Flavobacterium sp. RHBU_3 TaxID=3391184 RepID=UPI0039853540
MRTADKNLENRNPLLIGRIVNHNNFNLFTTNGNEELWTGSQDEEENYEYQFEEGHHDAGDYINCDHSNHNRSDNRYGWYEPQE